MSGQLGGWGVNAAGSGCRSRRTKHELTALYHAFYYCLYSGGWTKLTSELDSKIFEIFVVFIDFDLKAIYIYILSSFSFLPLPFR